MNICFQVLTDDVRRTTHAGRIGVAIAHYGPNSSLWPFGPSELTILLLQALSEPEFYGDLMYKFRKNGKCDFPYHFKKIIVRDKKIVYNIDVLGQAVCLVVNPIKVNNFVYLFDCTTIGRASD